MDAPGMGLPPGLWGWHLSPHPGPQVSDDLGPRFYKSPRGLHWGCGWGSADALARDIGQLAAAWGGRAFQGLTWVLISDPAWEVGPFKPQRLHRETAQGNLTKESFTHPGSALSPWL